MKFGFWYQTGREITVPSMATWIIYLIFRILSELIKLKEHTDIFQKVKAIKIHMLFGIDYTVKMFYFNIEKLKLHTSEDLVLCSK